MKMDFKSKVLTGVLALVVLLSLLCGVMGWQLYQSSTEEEFKGIGGNIGEYGQ